jgi:hypothetical protein
MNIRVRRTAVVVFALTLSLNAASLFAAPRERNFRDGGPSFVQQIMRRFKQVLKPFTTEWTNTDPNAYPGPPKP